MDIPERILFGGHTIPVRRHTSQVNEKVAYYDVKYDFISISNDIVSESICAEALMHELIEMINWRFSLELSHRTITCLGESLFSVLRNNKELDFNNELRMKL